MKYKHYLLLLILLVSQSIISNTKWNGKHTKEKIIKKEFVVNKDALLKINNSYGNINIVTYPGTAITIEVKIKTNGNNLEQVEERLNTINVDFQASPSMVSAKTIFGKTRSNSWWTRGRNNNVTMEVNYIVKLPITNSVDLDNDYGNINLDRLEGRATINCDYGKITTKELMADNNLIVFDYTNNSYFEYIKSGKIKADYSGFTVSKTKHLEIIADYSKSVVEVAEEVNYTCDYGSITIEKANIIKGKGDYLTARFGEIYKNIRIASDYGSIKINSMTANAGNVDINSNYTGVTIGYTPEYQFNLDCTLSYASLRGVDDFYFTKKNIRGTSKYYQGYNSHDNTNNLIKITSNYGNITFKKN